MCRFRLWAIALGNFLAVAKVLGLTALLLSWALLVAMPVQAATRVSPRLEEQVLQILRDHPEAIVESVQAYQQQALQQQQQAQQTFLQQLKADPQKVIGVSPTTGQSAKVLLIEFSDFQCPYCAEASKTLKQLIAHQGEVTLVYKHFPLTTIHDQAMPAAIAAWAAGQQGKFWEYHNALFDQQDKLGEELYLATAKNLNLNLEQFEQDRNSDAATVAIGQDIQLAQKLGIAGTPFFVMNGETFSGAVQLPDVERILASANKPSAVN